MCFLCLVGRETGGAIRANGRVRSSAGPPTKQHVNANAAARLMDVQRGKLSARNIIQVIMRHRQPPALPVCFLSQPPTQDISKLATESMFHMQCAAYVV